MHRVVTVLLSVLLLSACSTAVIPKQEIPAAVRAELKVSEVAVTVPAGTAWDLQPRLQEAVERAVSDRNRSGATVAKLNVVVTRYELVNAGQRALSGPFGGSNRLYVAVDVVDAASGATIGKFDVERESNPGGYGIFYSQAQGVISSVAESIADQLYGTRPN